MIDKTVVVTGGTGFVGSHLSPWLEKNGYTVVVLTRDPSLHRGTRSVVFESYDNMDEHINGAYAVINLAGKNLFDSRWTDKIKSEILKSRVQVTRAVVESIEKANTKPEVFISGSAVGYYGSRGSDELSESEPAGEDFLAHVCLQWEEEAKKAKASTRVVLARIGIVIGEGGGALEKMLTPFSLFIGGPLGDGSQYFPWVHIDDICKSLGYLLENKNCDGAYNLAAPNPVTMKEFATALGKAMNRPSALPVPEFALKLLLGEASEALLASQRVIPTNLINEGFEFDFKTAESALKSIVG